MTDERRCLQCNESQGAIRASQREGDPIYCAAVDYEGDVLWEMPQHRFRDWTDRELIDVWRVLPEHVNLYRRILSAYDIADEHRAPMHTAP